MCFHPLKHLWAFSQTSSGLIFLLVPASPAQQLEEKSSAPAHAPAEVLTKSQPKGQAIALLFPRNQSQNLQGPGASLAAFGERDLYES